MDTGIMAADTAMDWSPKVTDELCPVAAKWASGPRKCPDRCHQKAGPVVWDETFGCLCVCGRYDTGKLAHDVREPPVIWKIPVLL